MHTKDTRVSLSLIFLLFRGQKNRFSTLNEVFFLYIQEVDKCIMRNENVTFTLIIVYAVLESGVCVAVMVVRIFLFRAV